jgi:hypothetical protein
MTERMREIVYLNCPRSSGKPGCKIANCVENVSVGLASNSASPVDTWLLKFKPGVTSLGEPLFAGFMKLWINPESLYERSVAYKDIDDYMNTLKGLDYEVKVYRDVIRPLVDNKICPNFVSFLADGQMCSFDDLSSVLGTEDINTLDSMRRNLAYMRDQKSGRPGVLTVGNEDNVRYITGREEHSWDYNFLISSAVPAGTKTFEEFIAADTRSFEIPKVVFQILAGCYAMSMCKMTHNDLHEGNTFIVSKDTEEEVTYIYGGVFYSFKTKYKALIFDFDRAYVRSIGDNPILEDEYLCTAASQCNRAVGNADMVKVLCYLYKTIRKPRMLKNIVKCLIKPGSNFTEEKLLDTFLRQDSCFFHDPYNEYYEEEGGVSMGEKEYAKLNNPSKILEEWGKAYDLIASPGMNVDEETTYACRPEMFRANGILKQGMSDDTLIREFSKMELRS